MNIQPSSVNSDADRSDSWIEDRLPPPSSFFPGTAYSDILEQAYRLVEEAEDITLMTGVKGIGKTTLVYRIQSDTPEHWLPCRVDASPMLHPDQLHNRLARCIDLQPSDDDDMAASVAAAFCKLRQQGRLPVVIVDDTEQLPISSLMALLRLHEQRAETTPSCALILLAQPDIDRTLTTHQLHAMGTSRFVRLELPRLAKDEIKGYVRHFLRMEGVKEEVGFSPLQMAALHSESAGIPGKVNKLVIRTLRDAIIPRRNVLPAWLVRWLRRIPPVTAMATAAVALLLLLTVLFQPQLDSLFQESEPMLASLPGLPEEQRQIEPTRDPEEKMAEPLDLPAVTERLDLEAEPVPQAPEPESGTGYRSGELAPTAVTPGSEQAMAVTREPPRPVTPRSPEVAPSVSTSAKSASKSAVTSKPAPAEPVAAGPRFRREAWLLRQRPDAYSLQILAAGSERSVRKFAQTHQLTTDVYYFKSERNGRSWIALLLGIYKDRKTAVTVLNMLPDSLREAGAWPRSLASVQAEIMKAR